jgi:hypothetical protein
MPNTKIKRRGIWNRDSPSVGKAASRRRVLCPCAKRYQK